MYIVYILQLPFENGAHTHCVIVFCASYDLSNGSMEKIIIDEFFPIEQNSVSCSVQFINLNKIQRCDDHLIN